MIKAFRHCVGSIETIQIEDSSRIILEIDIEPSNEVCQNLTFYYTNLKDKIEICLRDGTQTLSSDNINKWTNEIESYAKSRWQFEWKLALGGDNLRNKLIKLFCRNRPSIDYGDFNYHLISNRPTNENDIVWTTYIRWSFIFDFDANTNGVDGLYNCVTKREDFFR